jgi:cell division protein FtsQ
MAHRAGLPRRVPLPTSATTIPPARPRPLYLLEINTQPGMTPLSLVPEQAVDRYGATMPVADVSRYTGMIVLTGPDAPAHAKALLDLLALEPDLGARVIAAQRVGARRWNLRLDNGVDIRLPEEEAAAAWRTLADMERDEGLIDRDLVMIDLRTPDRLVVRLSPAAAELRRTPGDDT